MKIDSRSWSRVVGLLASLAALGIPASATAQGRDAVVIRGLIAAARVPGARWPDFPRHLDDVARLYASHDGAPVWFREGRLSLAGRAAIGSLVGAASHGLVAEDYDAAALDSLAQGSGPALPPAEVGRLDLLLSVDLIRYLDDLRRGRSKGVVPGGPVAPADAPDWADVIGQALRGDTISTLADHAAPALTQYRNLRSLLARYRRLARDSVELTPLPAEAPVAPGQGYAALAELRRRLVLLGDLADAATTDTLYTGEAVEAVRRFQQRHGLEPDGVIGPATSAALNVPPARRVRQIELALERIRWLPQLGREPFLVVNIPAFYLFGFDSAGGTGAPSFTSRVVVGRALDTETPVLHESLRYVEFRPYWNVPRSIVVNEILPRLRRDPEYLGRHQMEIVGPADRPVDDTASSDLLRRLTRGEVRIRQRPGPSNALGLVKFVFPNAANVYLHDTPDTELFSRSRRDFSHGCIRVEQAEALAVWALRGQPAWDSAQVHAAVKGPGTRRAFLPRPMPVAILYTTAVATPSGEGWFFEDVYDHDRELEEILRAGPSPP
jgi:murein L,D-transpeptidase YcbB/YkuD